MGVGGQHHVSAALPPGKRPGTHCTGGWVGPRAGVDRCRKSRSNRHSIPGPSIPYIGIASRYSDLLSRPIQWNCTIINVEHLWNNWQENYKVRGTKPVPLPFCTQEIPHGLSWEWTGTSTLRSRILEATGIVRSRFLSLGPKLRLNITQIIFLVFTLHWGWYT
jgi:hypothetical protein